MLLKTKMVANQNELLDFNGVCQRVVTPVLTSAKVVKMVKTEIKEWSSGQGLLEPL